TRRLGVGFWLPRFKKVGLTFNDSFAGVGGEAAGLEAAGLTGRVAANHNRYRVRIHKENHDHIRHFAADLQEVRISDFPPADVLWCSPECKNHTTANGKKRGELQVDMYGEPINDEKGVRS